MAHYVRWVLGITGEGSIVSVVNVPDHNRTIAPRGVPHKVKAVLERAFGSNVGSTVGVVENLNQITEILFHVCSSKHSVLSFKIKS